MHGPVNHMLRENFFGEKDPGWPQGATAAVDGTYRPEFLGGVKSVRHFIASLRWRQYDAKASVLLILRCWEIPRIEFNVPPALVWQRRRGDFDARYLSRIGVYAVYRSHSKRGTSAKLNRTTSSPVTVLRSWYMLSALTPATS